MVCSPFDKIIRFHSLYVSGTFRVQEISAHYLPQKAKSLCHSHFNLWSKKNTYLSFIQLLTFSKLWVFIYQVWHVCGCGLPASVYVTKKDAFFFLNSRSWLPFRIDIFPFYEYGAYEDIVHKARGNVCRVSCTGDALASRHDQRFKGDVTRDDS